MAETKIPEWKAEQMERVRTIMAPRFRGWTVMADVLDGGGMIGIMIRHGSGATAHSFAVRTSFPENRIHCAATAARLTEALKMRIEMHRPDLGCST